MFCVLVDLKRVSTTVPVFGSSWYLSAGESLLALHHVCWAVLIVAFKTVAVLIWMTMALTTSRLFLADRLGTFRLQSIDGARDSVLGFLTTGSVSRSSTVRIFRALAICISCFTHRSVCSVGPRKIQRVPDNEPQNCLKMDFETHKQASSMSLYVRRDSTDY